MKRTSLLLILLLAIFSMAWAQQEWTSPHMGYSNTKMLSVDKVELQKNKTLLHVTVTAESGYNIWIAKDAYLLADGQRYALRKVPTLGIDKRYTMPDSGKVHFAMQFEPLPMNTRRLHFVEGESPTGWRMFNICSSKDELAKEWPEEWRNVEYADLKHLPESRLCDDSTTIKVQILNYVPEAGKYLEAFFTPIEGEAEDALRHAFINADGTATMKLHLCFPQAVQMRIGQDSFFPLLVMPGEEVSVLMDLGKGGTNPTMAFKGALAKVNYEVNLLGEEYRKPFQKGKSFFEWMLQSNQQLPSFPLYREVNQKIRRSDFCGATKEWFALHITAEFIQQTKALNRYLDSKLQKDLKSAGSSLLDNKYVNVNIERMDMQAYNKEISNDRSMTLCPRFIDVMYWEDPDRGGIQNTYNRGILDLIFALARNRGGSYEEGLKKAEDIKDPYLKAFYPIAAQRWQQYVDSISRLPHLHFDQHQGLEKEVLKKALLDDYRGKDIVLLLYDSHRKEHLDNLKELEPLMAKSDSQRVVFLHIDMALGSIANWASAARQWTGEHYHGYKTRYDYMDSSYDRIHPTFRCDCFSPDGTQTLTTSDVEVAKKAIEKLVEE